MKSISFLRNTWKKWEQKSPLDGSDNTPPSSPRDSRKQQFSKSTTTSSRSLTVTLKQLPVEDAPALQVEGSWQISDSYQPPSPIYDQFTQSDLTLRHKESVRFGLDKSYCSRATLLPEQSSKACKVAGFPPRKPSTTHSTPQQYVALRAKSTPWPVVPERQKDGITEQHSSTHTRKVSPPSSPRTPSLPSFQLLPPIDLNYGPGSKFGDSLAGGKNCKCDPTPHSRHDAHCPKYTFADAQKNMASSRSTTVSQRSLKTVHAILDLSHDSKPRSLYHSTGSTPHLPYRDRAISSSRSEDSSYSAGSSEAEHFPLSLFPLPPPLIVRKRIPAPLVLRNVTPTSASAHSSRDSTPVGTPTTPRFSALNSPSQSNVASPSKKFHTGRPSTNFSPPPFSPPNSPLPKPPVAQDAVRRSPEQTIHPLRTVQSNANLRGALPFPAKHRLTSSEPISDQSSVPIRRPPKPRPAERPKNIQTYMQDNKDQSMNTVNPNVETQVQWGYAF